MMQNHSLLLAGLLATGALSACGSDQVSTGDDNELISRVSLVMTRSDDPTRVVTASFDDPDGPGGDAPTVDPIALEAGRSYATEVHFFNGLDTPPSDITIEISDESYQHQIFFTGDAVSGPASDHAGAPITQAYADVDENGLPVGLLDTLTVSPGVGSLTVTLRHLPTLNGAVQKTADLVAQVKASGFGALGGSSDAQVTFPVAIPVGP